MGFSIDVDISVITVFLQGLLSFFSPCVLPLLPLYIGYLAGGTATVDAEGRRTYQRSKVMVNTLFFVLGISFAFLLLGLGMTAVGQFFSGHAQLFARIGGVLVFAFGLYQLGVFGQPAALAKERRLPFRLNTAAMSPITALLMGFTFSFAWTPCVGPALASVLIMVSSASTKAVGLLLIGVYTLGFVLPFLAVAFFTVSLLGFFKKHMKIVQYTVKIGAVLMLIMGVLMFTGAASSLSQNLAADSEESSIETSEPAEESSQTESSQTESSQTESSQTETSQPDTSQAASESSAAEESEEPQESENALPAAFDFTLTDQYGNSHTLSDYQGQTVFLNFWATWCPPCRAEMPDIQKIYEEYQENEDDSLVILGIASPDVGDEKSKEGITEFLEENGYTYPVLMDEGGEQFLSYKVRSLPTTYMIDKDGNIFGYVNGQISEETMRSIIEQTMSGVRK